ncbi:hypothetical protein MKX08_007888 [Trichoderma sp. CBMAI-0020]|nr:hypothetical protein MKX08_007888 [Trichoderma sp. CBMAI-0020]
MNFSGRNTALREELKPKERIRINHEGEEEEWADSLHNVRAGHQKDVTCNSCFVNIIGLAWQCIKCPDKFPLCFKCYNHRFRIHDSEHIFRGTKPFFDLAPSSTHRRNTASKDVKQDFSGYEEAESALDASVDESRELAAPEIADQDEFSLDDLDLDAYD